MCTKEDLTELQRATFLLKKGYEIQKISVSTYLNNCFLFVNYSFLIHGIGD